MKDTYSFFACPEERCHEHSDTRIYCIKHNRLMLRVICKLSLVEIGDAIRDNHGEKAEVPEEPRRGWVRRKVSRAR